MMDLRELSILSRGITEALIQTQPRRAYCIEEHRLQDSDFQDRREGEEYQLRGKRNPRLRS